jgi:hypothetical protein
MRINVEDALTNKLQEKIKHMEINITLLLILLQVYIVAEKIFYYNY